MTKTEVSLLRESVSRVIKANHVAWDDLKREMFNDGYQSCYQSQGDFKPSAIEAVFSLSNDIKEQLVKEWKRFPRLLKRETNEEILNQYALAVVEKIVERAWAVQYRYWPDQKSDGFDWPTGVI